MRTCPPSRHRVGGACRFPALRSRHREWPGYLRDALREAGIGAGISAVVAKEDTNEARYAVVVPAAELSAALEMRHRFLPDLRHERDRGLLTPKPEAAALGKSAGAALLGVVVGIRVGRGSPQLTAIYCLSLGSMAFLGVWFSLRSVPHRGGRPDDGSTSGPNRGDTA